MRDSKAATTANGAMENTMLLGRFIKPPKISILIEMIYKQNRN
jgi:hypothetical protein